MYLSGTTETLQIVCDVAAVTTEPTYAFSWNDITATGMTLPQSASTGNMTGSTDVDAVLPPAAGATRQIIQGTIYNADTTNKLITVKKDVGGADYTIVQVLLSPGMTLHYSREHNWSLSGEKVNTTKDYNITSFTSSGTWTKPSGLKAALVTCVGAGGGGGGGRRGAALTNRFGGGGAGSGAIVCRLLLGSALASSYAVTAGGGGTSGASATVDNTNGGNGGNGSDCSFGALVVAKGGSGGTGGSSASGNAGGGGAATSCTPAFGPFAHSGSGGFNGQTTFAGTAGQALISNFLIGGTGGCGINSADVVGTTSPSGSQIYNFGFVSPVTSGGTHGSNNLNMSLTLNLIRTGPIGPGGSGHGGYSTVLNGRDAGYGSGAGGGAGVLNGTNSGTGGVGGAGICVVFEIF